MLDRIRAALAGRYAIEHEIGAGGMATVWLARDLKHNRAVAIKILRPELSAALGAERFLEEIRVTARLAHPHILPLYDSGEVRASPVDTGADAMDGFSVLYYVMPFVEGESLRERLTREQRLAVADAVRIARDVADALAYAHARDVIHRDIKPENVLLQSGHALVADFGIARALDAARDDRMTATGILLGTPAYMSPEQASGEEIDGRSDVYALACVLFEMLTGEAPFSGPNAQAVIMQRFTQPPPSAIARRPDIPTTLDSTLRQALARDPEERIPSAASFAERLGTMSTVAVAVPDAARESTPSIAVLPFANMSADPETEYFSDGITEEILNALARLGGLRVIARTSSFAFKGKNMDVREIGRTLGAAHVLEGSVRKAGNRLRITAQLIDAVGGHHLWSDRYDREMSDVFAVQDEITDAIRGELSRRLLGIRSAPASATPNIDPETYELFLRGRYLLARRAEGMRHGMGLLQQVVARAPDFAEGHVALGGAYMMLTLYCALRPQDGFERMREHGRTALEIDPQSAGAHRLLATASFFLDWDWDTAGRHFARAEALAPDNAANAAVASLYWSSLDRMDEALRHARHAVTLDPLNPSMLTQLADTLYAARRHHEAIAVCDRIIEIAPEYSEGYRCKGQYLDEIGRTAEALPLLERAMALSGRLVWALPNLARAYARLGRRDDVQAIAAELEARSKTEIVPPIARVQVAAWSDPPDFDRAFAILDEAIEVRDYWLVMLRVEPTVDPLRSDPRFETALARIGIPAQAPRL